MSNRAWVTLATNDSYGLGALVLAHSLRRVNSVYPSVVLITPSVTEPMRDRLRAVYAEVVIVDVLDSRDAAHLALLQRPELGITFTKIHCWGLTQYEKCVFLDADTLIVQNCDELFDREELSAAPDVGWPDCFNSGVFVYKPSAETFEQLIKFAQERGSFDGGDQGLLNSFFSDWARGDINKHLPFLYNVTSAAFYSYLPALKHYGQNIKIIHFIGAAKPWLQQFNFESRTVEAPEHLREFLQLWWDLFVSQVHTQLDVAMVEVPEAPPELPPQDLNQHYEPTVDPDSEFPWHHPEAQIQEQTQALEIDITQFHDPWQIYKGNIPPNKDDPVIHHSDLQRVENLEEIRKYAWDYKPPHDSVHNNSTTHDSNVPYQTELYQTNHECSYHNQSENTDQYWNSSIQQHTNEHYDQHQQLQLHQQEQVDLIHHHHHEHQNYSFEHDQSYLPHNFQHTQFDHFNHTQYHNHEQPRDNSSHLHQENLQNNSSQTQQSTYLNNFHKLKDHPQQQTHLLEHEVEAVHHVSVHYDKRKKLRRRRINRIDIPLRLDSTTNGDAFMDDIEEYDDIIPRHPYDGYYLRHRATIDSRGRKICSHEIPPTPSPSPLPSPLLSPRPESPTSLDGKTPAEDANNQGYEKGVQSGVAGNLARVVPGAPGSQREALDELTRRQGWEAGNIDYMGADSFDKIWAKISQTLNQPRVSPPKQLTKEPTPPPKQPTPPKETSPPKQPAEAAAAVIEIAQEAVTIDASTTPAPAETPVAPEIPAPVATETPTPVTTEVSAPVSTEVSAPTPAEATAPVSGEVIAPVPAEVTAPVKAEAPASVPEETAAPVTGEAPAPVTTATPVPVPVEATPVPAEASAPVPTEVPAPAPTEVSAPAPAPVPAEASAPASVETLAPVPTEASAPAPTEAAAPESAKVSAPSQAEVAPVSAESPAPVSTSASVPVTAESLPSVPVETQAPAPVEAPLPVQEEVPASVEAVPVLAEPAVATDLPTTVETPAPAKVPATDEVSIPAEIPATVESPAEVPVSVEAVASQKQETAQKTETPVPPTPPVTPKSTPEGSTPVTEIAPALVAESEKTPEAPKPVESVSDAPASPAVAAEAPATAALPETTPEKPASVTDSPPLANTPSKEEAPPVPAAKSEERRKPAGKLQLSPPAAADPLPTPDSEQEDAAALAGAIIASELRTPTVAAPEPSATPASPQAPASEERLAVEAPEVPTPPVGNVSLAQIGVKSKGKSSTAAQIESSVSEKSEPESPTPSPAQASKPADAPKKKVVKKVAKKEGASSGDTPVPPPRKKEKKPKE